MTNSFASFAGALALSSAFAATAMAAPFDGHWSVRVMTDTGQCDASYRIPLRIAKGQVSYAGSGNFKVSGSVAGSGAIKVNIIYGHSTSGGAGRLAGNRGSGTWSGAGPAASCSGRWEADRVS